MSIQKKLLEFRGLVHAVQKTANNPFFNSSYADINTVISTITPALDELGLVFTQCPDIKDGGSVLITTISIADDPKEFIESTVQLLLPTEDMQKMGSAITYARRYALISMFGLATEDDDGNDASKGKTPTQKFNSRVKSAFELIKQAKKGKDMKLAQKVFDTAKAEEIVQVMDKCYNTFPEYEFDKN